MDQDWQRTKEVVDGLVPNGIIVGPLGFDWPASRFYTYDELALVAAPDCIVIQKAMIGVRIDPVTVADLAGRLFCNFANKTFVVYSTNKVALPFCAIDAEISTQRSIAAAAVQNAQQMRHRDAAVDYLRLAMCTSLKAQRFAARLPGMSYVEAIARRLPCFVINLASWPYLRYFRTAAEVTEYLSQLLWAGEFNRLNRAVQRLAAGKKNDKLLLEHSFRCGHWHSVEMYCSRQIDRGDDSDRILTMLTWAQTVLGKERCHLNMLIERILSSSSVAHDIGQLYIDLGSLVEEIWAALQSNPHYRAYIASRYLPIRYVEATHPVPQPPLESAAAPTATFSPHGQMRTDAFDAVFTWVDPADLEWQAARLKASEGYVCNDEFSGDNRFLSIGEIYVAIELLIRNVPFLRHVFVVTPNSELRFEGARLSAEARARLVFVSHKELLGDSVTLPCFNSDAIESQLHRIPGLSEHFVYLNDDFLVLRDPGIHGALQRRHFFVDRRSWKTTELSAMTGSGARDAITARIFYERFGYLPSFSPCHQPYLCCKAAFTLTNHVFEKALAETLYAYQFRQTGSLRYLELMFWLSAEAGLQQPVAFPANRQKTFVGLSDEQLHIILRGKDDLVSLNNMNRHNESNFKALVAQLGTKGAAPLIRRRQPVGDETDKPRTLFIDCSSTHRSSINTGIQRVVRNIARHAPEIAERHGYAVKLVAFREGHCLEISLSEFRPLAFGARRHQMTARRFSMHILSWVDRLRIRLASLSASPAWENLVNAPHYRFGLARCVLYPLLLTRTLIGRFSMGRTSNQPVPAWGATTDLSGDILLLADSTWDVADIWPAATQFKQQGGYVSAVIYDLIPLSHPSFCDQSLVHAFSHWIRESVSCVDYYLCISRSTETVLRSFLLDAHGTGQTGYFHLGSDLDLTQKQAGASHRVVKIAAGDGPIFIVVGSIEPRKNLEFVLDAFECVWAQNPGIKLVLVGHNTWKVDAFLERVRQHPLLNTRLFWVRDASDTDLEYLYQQATALVFASIIEGFGLPIVEAMQRGLPVLCSDIPAFREIADGRATFFSLQTTRELVEAVRQAAEAQAGRQAPVRHSYRWLSWHESTRILLDKLAARVVLDRGSEGAGCG